MRRHQFIKGYFERLLKDETIIKKYSFYFCKYNHIAFYKLIVRTHFGVLQLGGYACHRYWDVEVLPHGRRAVQKCGRERPVGRTYDGGPFGLQVWLSFE